MSELNGLQIYEGKYTGPQRDAHFDWQTNPDLIDNPYFIGGGTSGKFPINQRRLTTYTGAGYGIDRWRTTDNSHVVAIQSDHIESIGVGLFQQYCEATHPAMGKTVTLSMLGYASAANKATLRFSNNSGGGATANIGTTLGLYKVTGTLGIGDGQPRLGAVFTNDASVTIYIYAMKLELGSEQTLAHQENGVWVLNEIPDYGEELRKCQRRYIKIVSPYAQGYGHADSSTLAIVRVPTPVTMAGNPSVAAGDGGTIAVHQAGYHAVTLPSTGTVDENGVLLTLTGTDLSPLYATTLYVSGGLVLSADL